MHLYRWSLALALASAPFASLAQTTALTTIATLSGPDAQYGLGVLLAPDGNYYGDTRGTIFKVTPSGTLTLLYTVPTGSGQIDSPLIVGIDGNFYGFASVQDGEGEIFKITPSGTLTNLYYFCSTENSSGYCADGGQPDAQLVQGSDGNFYGVTDTGGDFNGGTIFKFNPNNNSLSTLYSFCSDMEEGLGCLNGGGPYSLIQGSDGDFYGTNVGITENQGSTIFKITSTGGFTQLYDFNAIDNAVGPLTQGANGNFYGTTGTGNFYQITPSGSLSNLANLATISGGLLLAGDGNFYGGGNPAGTSSFGVFRITPAGGVSNVYNFGSEAGILYGQTDGGSLYGLASAYPDSGAPGTLYKLSFSPPIPGAVQLQLSSTAVDPNDSVTLTWRVLNGFSTTLQQCYASVQYNSPGAGVWAGRQTGIMVNGTYTGSSIITPTASGVYTYALICGGIETGFASLTVGNVKAATSTALTATTPVTLGSVVSLNATVSTTQFVAPFTGNVTFSFEGITLGTVSASNGTAALNLEASNIPTGTYPIKATYSGDANYESSSAIQNVTVLGYATAINLAVEPTTLSQGQSATLSATVARTAVSGTPTGKVTFYYGSVALGTATVSGGHASLTLPTSGTLAPGSYAVIAKYSGDSTDQPATSSSSVVVLHAATLTSLTVSPNPVPANSAVTLSVKVKETYGTAIPTGAVNFAVGDLVVGTATLDYNGAASVNLSSVGINPGVYPVFASYSGDASNGASTSPTVSVTIK